MEDKTLYVVSGFMRTGTSMMMRALEAGGLEAKYAQSRDIMKNRFADAHYDPNVGGLYELAPHEYREWGFPRRHAGTLIKALTMGIPKMAMMPDGIRAVLMRRDTEEIRQSYLAFFNKRLANVDHLDRNMEDIIERIENRKDVLSLDVFWYRELLKNPLSYFEILASAGWPIDPVAAAATVDPTFCRFRRENLTVGVV